MRILTKEEAEYLVDTNINASHSARYLYQPALDGYIVHTEKSNHKWVIYGREESQIIAGFRGGWLMKKVDAFFDDNPAQYYVRMPEPEFDLDDMELAEIIMDELK